MAATFNESQKIDYLWKKVGYGVTKTAEPTVKQAFNENIPSPLLYRGDLVWMESDQITGNPPASTTSIIEVYKDGVGSFSPSVECTEDGTAPDNQTWQTNLTNWVPTQFGDNYLVQVYVANTGVTNPQTSGTKLFQAGSGTDDTWFFDYQSGVLNFNGANVPSQIASPITGKSVYVVGYRYVGLIGVTNQPSGNISGNTNIGNLNFTDTTISTITTNSNIYLSPNGTGNLYITSSVATSGNITANAGAFFIGDGGYLANLNTSGVANGNSNVNIPIANGNINLTATGNTTLVVTGTGANVSGYLTVNGNLTATNITSNVSSNTVVANSANISGNLYVADTANVGNLRTNNLLYANGQPWDLQEAAGANTQLQFNDGNNNFGASANLTFDQTTNLLTVVGNVQFNNANLGNLSTSNYANISGNLYVADTATIGNVRTNNILYANGSPWDLQEAAGSNTQIQFNDGNTNFGASANFTFNQTTNLLTVVGNSQFNNANLGNLAIANFIDVSSNLSVTNTANVGNVRTNNLLYANGSAWDFGGTPGGSNTQIQFNDSNEFGGSANFTFDNTTNLLTVVGTANVTTLNATGNITGNTGIFGNITTSGPSGDITGANVISTVTLIASGNITSANANLGNLAIANFVNVSSNLSVTNTANVGNLRTNNILYANGTPYIFTTNAAGNTTQVQFNNGNAFTASANFTFDDSTQLLTVIGNTQFNNANLGNLAIANFVNVSSNLSVINTANVGNLRTNNLLYANGTAWDLGGNPAGSNTQIQFNDSNEFGGSANFTFDKTTSLLSVVGNANIANINVSGNITGSNGIFGNLFTTGPSGDITGVNLISTVTLTASGNITSANANLGNTSIANNVVANTFRMGVGVNEFYHSTVYFATTNSTSPNQLLYSTSLANLSAIDFTIISTDETSNTRQTAKITAAVLGTEVVFNEYSGLYINGGVGSFSVNYQAGAPDTVQLVVTPDSTNLTKYNMMIIQYAK